MGLTFGKQDIDISYTKSYTDAELLSIQDRWRIQNSGFGREIILSPITVGLIDSTQTDKTKNSRTKKKIVIQKLQPLIEKRALIF